MLENVNYLLLFNKIIYIRRKITVMIAVWWTSLSISMKILWAVTLSASLIFIFQSIMTFVGADAGDSALDGDFDFDSDHASDLDSGMNLLTFRNLVNFCLGFGWSAILLQESVTSTPLLLVIATFAGLFLVVAVMYLFKLMGKLQQSGNINVYRAAEGCVGKVYIPIPANRTGCGKVQITINNSVREYDAVTEGDALPTGSDIIVAEVVNESTMLVEPINSLII